MLRQGSYRLVEGQADAITIKRSSARHQSPAQWNETDWLLALHDSIGEQAQFAYYEGLDAGYKLGVAQGRLGAEKAAGEFGRMLHALEMSLLEFYNGLER